MDGVVAHQTLDAPAADTLTVASQESSYAKVDTGWLAALCLELDGRTIAQGGV